MLHVEHRPTDIYLARIERHPDHQGRGIGGQLIRGLLHQARKQGRDLTLDALVVNQGAQALYRRLGLHEVTRHGANNNQIRTSPSRLRRPDPQILTMTRAGSPRRSRDAPGPGRPHSPGKGCRRGRKGLRAAAATSSDASPRARPECVSARPPSDTPRPLGNGRTGLCGISS
ncbi:N-acetyltransferase [Streptomyces sparsogenes]|uniref:GNAT family N-acetyltransferase n=1 Tax=Streptomyces sparsogenes TaxID=67365 RepID=UPI0033223DBB